MSANSERHKRITNTIAKFIGMDMRPLDSVNDPGFIQLIETLEPRYDLTSRTHITKTVIPALHDKIKEKVQKQVKESSFVALTTDGWTGRSCKSFITVTAHLLTLDWNMVGYVLTTYEAVDAHTSENLKADFLEVLGEWQDTPA